ncbi:MAG: Nif3-like dinuclear metal center hexameric protein [Bacteroidota bacterium]|nr:Nif3-like dinuclear metal center hexameric protein [Bacteroidota bacterium]
MRIKDFRKQFEIIAPPAIAWKGDNVGLLVGRENDIIQNIVIALDLTMDVAKEADKKKANVIITHHPLLFHPLKAITESSRIGEIVLYLIEHKINLYAAHTNLDSVQWGVNFTLANVLGLKDVKVLSPLNDSLTSISVFIPREYVENVAEAMHSVGGGTFTKYDQCSFRGEGIGTFRGMNNANPFIGAIGKKEIVEEIRLEMLVEQWKLNAVVSAMLKAHPYEEVAYNIVPLKNRNSEYGLGAIGTLRVPMKQGPFLSLIKKKLGASAVRYSGKSKSIQRVAVCGGSGAELIDEAVAKQADAMITADLKYHTFQDFEQKILLVDAGHFETEHVVLPILAKKISQICKQHNHFGKIYITKHSTNPVHIF